MVPVLLTGGCSQAAGAPRDTFYVQLIDLTERKRAEAALLEAKQRAEHLERAKSQFLVNMSHEIRTPMSGIIGMAQLALRSGLDARQRDYVSKIETAARSLLGILNDILDFSKIEAGQIQIERVPFALRPLVDKVITLLEITAQEKGLTLSADVSSSLSPGYAGDPLRITQVLTNLVGNALKFTATGAIRLVIHSPAPDWLRFEVHDTGIGLPEPGTAAASVPGLFPGRWRHLPAVRRHRSGAGDQQATGRTDGGADLDDQHPRAGELFHLRTAGPALCCPGPGPISRLGGEARRG